MFDDEYISKVRKRRQQKRDDGGGAASESDSALEDSSSGSEDSETEAEDQPQPASSTGILGFVSWIFKIKYASVKSFFDEFFFVLRFIANDPVFPETFQWTEWIKNDFNLNIFIYITSLEMKMHYNQFT